jgi:hypothetical protein
MSGKIRRDDLRDMAEVFKDDNDPESEPMPWHLVQLGNFIRREAERQRRFDQHSSRACDPCTLRTNAWDCPLCGQPTHEREVE